MISRIKQTSNLADIYPDTSSQLCNKHVKLLSSLKNTFQEIYDDMEPEKYVIVNGIAKVIDLGNEINLSFALENGITVLFKRTYQNEDIYINGNHIEEEIIFNSNGRHTEGIHEKVDQIKDMIHMIRSHSPKNKSFFGAILYVHSNIGESLFSFQESFMLGVLFALLLVHDEFQNFSKADILGILQTVDKSLSSKIISNILDQYEINQCNIECPKVANDPETNLQINLIDPLSESDKSIGTHESNESIKSNSENSSLKSMSDKDLKKVNSTTTGSNNSIASLQETSQILKQEIFSVKVQLQDTYKLIVCRLDLSNEQLQAYQQKMRRISEVSEILQQEKTNILEDILSSNNQNDINYVQENKILLNTFKEGKIRFSDYIKQKHDLDIEYEIFDEEVVELINEIRSQARFMKNFCIIEGTVLLISMEKQYYAEIMCFLRRLLNNYKMSTHHFLQTKHKVDEDKLNAEIGQIMFTSSASLGCAIYTSTEEAWL